MINRVNGLRRRVDNNLRNILQVMVHPKGFSLFHPDMEVLLSSVSHLWLKQVKMEKTKEKNPPQFNVPLLAYTY